MVSQAWKLLPPDERAPWDEMARRDKARFDLEKTWYKGPWKVPILKDPKAPRRPYSAFLSFSNDKRDLVKKENEGLSTTKISAILSQMWKDAGAVERANYAKAAREDGARYKREMEAYHAEASFERKEREEFAVKAVAGAELVSTDAVVDTEVKILASDQEADIVSFNDADEMWEPLPLSASLPKSATPSNSRTLLTVRMMTGPPPLRPRPRQLFRHLPATTAMQVPSMHAAFPFYSGPPNRQRHIAWAQQQQQQQQLAMSYNAMSGTFVTG
jgi:HMG (high mobility group) box/HMG-box domain